MVPLHPLDQAVELMYYGHRGVIREADDYLAGIGLSQAHHRMMYVLARAEGLNVGDLVSALGISKQAARRPLKDLVDRGLVGIGRDPDRRRCKHLGLTERGRKVEAEATGLKRRVLERAFSDDAAGREAWTRIMEGVAANA